MSESDDSDILADIQALDEALTLGKRSPQQYVGRSNASSDVDGDNNDDYFDYLGANRHIDESLNAYEINTRLITGLTIAKKKLTILLEECEQKIKLLDEKMTGSKDESSSNSKLALSNASIPYFKDKDNFSAPKNYDTKLKETRGELSLLFVKKPSRWSGKDRETLLNAISNQAIESVLCGEFDQKIDESTSDNENKKVKLLPRNFNEMVGVLGEKEFDWHKISAMDFNNKHSPGECRAMWNIYLHPEFRKSEWTVVEDKKLSRCAKEYNHQDWDAITRKLGTNRSAYQCFIRYNTIKKVPLAGRVWTRQEDRHLRKIMNTIRIGDYISWSEVANHMRHRTKQQIYVRWTYRKAPHLRKGRFTFTETATLLKAVDTYGMDFCKISSTVIPHRTSIQLQERYHTVMSKTHNWNVWSVNDDMRLINLQLKYNNNWSKIATYFVHKSRTQVRHRYNALLNYAMKGVSIESIPRPTLAKRNKKCLDKKLLSISAVHTRTSTTLREMQRVVNIFDIQLRLYETLCFPPSVKPNNFEEESYGIKQLACDTKRLLNTLNLLNANLDIPGDFLNYVQLNNREKRLLVSLRERMNVESNSVQNKELIENCRMRMFGYVEVSESDFFIPPLPFDGYVKVKRIKNKGNTSIDYDLGASEKFLIDVPTNFSTTSLPFISIEEEVQFYKLGQLFIKDYHNFDQQTADIYKKIKCIFSFAERSTSSKRNNMNSKISSKVTLEDYEEMELNKLKDVTSIEDDEDETSMSNAILPNQATLLGLKNLLLWKLLYDCRHESHVQCELLASFGRESKSEQTATNSCFMQTKSAEYQLLRTRLLQLFKVPLSLSNTMLQVQGPEAIFSKEKTRQCIASRKRKFKAGDKKEATKSVELNENNGSNISINVCSQFESDPLQIVTMEENRPRVRSCKVILKKYKISRKNSA